jgi:hypothetical protein
MHVIEGQPLGTEGANPHGLPDAEFDAIFTTDRPVLFAYHGCPWLIHRMTYRRAGHPNLHVRGFKEQGTTTVPHWPAEAPSCANGWSTDAPSTTSTPAAWARTSPRPATGAGRRHDEDRKEARHVQ